MERTLACPCCRGHGIVDCHPRLEEGELSDCEHCGGSGQVELVLHRILVTWLVSQDRRAVEDTGATQRRA